MEEREILVIGAAPMGATPLAGQTRPSDLSTPGTPTTPNASAAHLSALMGGIPNCRGSTSRSRRGTGNPDGTNGHAAQAGDYPSDGELSPATRRPSSLELGVTTPGAASEAHPQWMKEQWEDNYKEAAIFLEEGINNEKFTHHPRCQEELPPYLLVHNDWFHYFDLGASLVILGLGFFEAPCHAPLCFPTQVHSSIELGTLLLITLQVILKTRWIGWRDFFKHRRTLIKVFTLVLMIVEALVVLVRVDSHFRVSRSLRPIFLIDNHYCGGVRRFIRQILQSLPPILDMLVLVFFIMLIYSVFGFYLFGMVDHVYFNDLQTSFISLFVLLTTANYPDVMMRSYNQSRWSAVFFVSYLSINLYFLMNLMLAVVYDAFTRIEKEKFRRLFLHKRKAAQHAFNLLVTKERPKEVSFQHFEGLVRAYKGITSPTESYLIFRLLNKSNSGHLHIDEFYDIYNATQYSWSLAQQDEDWFSTCHPNIADLCTIIKNAVKSTWFEYTVCLIVLSNGIILVVQTAFMDSPTSNAEDRIYAPWVSYFFVALYTIEAILKLIGLGFKNYFASYWNMFDFGVTVLGILSLILEILDIPLFYVVILRPLRLLTLFRMKKRFRDVFGTAVILYPRLTSAVIVLLLTYYFFAIIGMECFHNFDLKDCCKNSSVEQYFSFVEGSNGNVYFYLNNFQSLQTSGVTLFELTVVNNWFVIMEGYAIVSGVEMSRVFFMAFYIFTMIVMTIIVAFILEAFLFRIQYKQYFSKEDEAKNLKVEVILTSEEIRQIAQARGGSIQDIAIPSNSMFKFSGEKSRTKEQLQMLMYTDEMDRWLAEAQLEETQSQARIQAAILAETSSNEYHDHGHGDNENIQIVQDDGTITAIHRPVLPELGL
ncbi:hypothetical protein TCAL_02815 [Tigriopus californicus]|uniref:Ion transport domain-containing protein n=1 Tax=Tigriopus californicus TaxID=6832 RepID=A0A553NX33_TIGCA|nr:two pore calcium channel protein 1-like [Tigriopus californicus]TRY69993.1 hypothetical protein TCAL_02815 [Tigriopus californicus]|eukprot:TCALIF_02815-PA protein Name:"Similar to Tpcn1 Two pore calcium channel protein 1 (Rattus norvegicus)" AED:0.09 eAED:0.09 QI:301/1/1/1/0.64/0.86/15/97/876